MTRAGKKPVFLSWLLSGPTLRQARNAVADQPVAKNSEVAATSFSLTGDLIKSLPPTVEKDFH